MVCCGLAEEEWEESGDAVGSWVPCWCPGDALLDRLLVQGLFGGGGGGAPGRSIGASIETGSSYSAVANSPCVEAMALSSVYSVRLTMRGCRMEAAAAAPRPERASVLMSSMR